MTGIFADRKKDVFKHGQVSEETADLKRPHEAVLNAAGGGVFRNHFASQRDRTVIGSAGRLDRTININGGTSVNNPRPLPSQG